MIRTHYVSELSAAMDGQEVTLAGWVHEVRETAKITFLLLRDSSGIVQVVGKAGDVDERLIKAMSLPKESVISVKGVVKASSEAKKGFEIIPREIIDLNPLSVQIPFEVTGKVPADIDVRLNHRHVDMRRRETLAIFKIQSTVLGAFVSFFSKRGFIQIRTPVIIAEASEGGSELFQVKYFERDAYLAQSPQLYKQLALIGGFDKVMMVVPVFRAEKSNTVYHTTELTQMDIEIAFADADDAISLLSKCFTYILKEVKGKNAGELEILGAKLEIPKVKVITYSNVIKKLKAKGYPIEFGHDFSREHEASLEELFGEAVIVRDFPTATRAFYSMPKDDNPELTDSFDLIYKGLEISSGARRIHNYEMLIGALKRKGLDPEKFGFYIDAFRCGAPPHAGWSIGLERLTMRITGAKNIREASLFPRDRKRLTP
jgi:aspartyl-tRNA synthetase